MRKEKRKRRAKGVTNVTVRGEFGAFFKLKRKERGLTLREFCEENGLDIPNISQLERGMLPPPQSTEKLTEYARHLQIKQGSDDWYEFFDLARKESGEEPRTLTDSEAINKAPIFFRTVGGEGPSREKLNELIEKIKVT